MAENNKWCKASLKEMLELEGSKAAIKSSQTSGSLPTNLEHVLPEDILVLLSELLVDHLLERNDFNNN